MQLRTHPGTGAQRLDYGFIGPDTGDERIFFHHSDVIEPECTSAITPGTAVAFEHGANRHGTCAIRVRLDDRQPTG